MSDEDNGSHVRIGLKDVYQQVQSMEKTVADAFGSLQLTLAGIKSHLETVDTRNQAADQLHKEHADRIRALEGIASEAKPVAAHADFEMRIRVLERFKYALAGGLILVNAVAVLVEYLLRTGGHG